MPEYKTVQQKRKFYDSREWKQLREERKRLVLLRRCPQITHHS